MMSIDPVCGMTVDASRAGGHSEFEDETYYFCCPECERRFNADPGQFAAPKPRSARVPCCGFAVGMVKHTNQRGIS